MNTIKENTTKEIKLLNEEELYKMTEKEIILYISNLLGYNDTINVIVKEIESNSISIIETSILETSI